MSQVKLEDFVVWKQLRVHDIRISRRRVVARYTLTMGDGEERSTNLIYSYKEQVFRPEAADSQNMASMMAAQVALNYGLFCEELVLDGLYDAADQQLLKDMLENTSREIYVNKLLADNEFLRAEFSELVHEKRRQYTAATLKFVNTNFEGAKAERKEAETDQDQYAILSSGGKDSLLSYGILNEMGQAHPVYVNESGRHWYTAYNAYHAMVKAEPRTARVWCNSDRIFNWMVRQMPFIRPNFQQIRADIYPIRLWTVAVFLWGVLPVARKRGVRNIIIGNEYDTTMQMDHHGTTHYAALYDQSKYFDNAFTRYYQRKGWNMQQFSLLRSLSELLILKILVKRYPALQQLQVSCHAAHKEGEVMKPCGKCEKCRRIVGMLTALDEDPARCGYSQDQIAACLRTLEAKKVKQIGSDAEHLYHLLLTKGALATNEHTRKLAKSHPEIMQLRFDNERSMMQDLPLFIRRPLLTLLAAYADGAVQLQQRKWTPVSPENLSVDSISFHPLRKQSNATE